MGGSSERAHVLGGDEDEDDFLEERDLLFDFFGVVDVDLDICLCGVKLLSLVGVKYTDEFASSNLSEAIDIGVCGGN